jgi:DNA-nicking Smr family endonuclease
VKKPVGKGGRKEPSSDASASDDHEIWWQAAATVEPLKRGKPRVHPASSGAVTETPAPPAKPFSKPDTRLAAKAPSAGNTAAAHSASAPRTKTTPIAPPELALFDRKSIRKIRGGRAEIEARVDLHGMRQDEAHGALRAFLRRCHSRGLRFVLVITGKGKTASATDSVSTEGSDRGVLKRNVPRWLEEPDVRSIVVSYTTAAIRHGGEGALYVHLRSKDRT